MSYQVSDVPVASESFAHEGEEGLLDKLLAFLIVKVSHDICCQRHLFRLGCTPSSDHSCAANVKVQQLTWIYERPSSAPEAISFNQVGKAEYTEASSLRRGVNVHVAAFRRRREVVEIVRNFVRLRELVLVHLQLKMLQMLGTLSL